MNGFKLFFTILALFLVPAVSEASIVQMVCNGYYYGFPIQSFGTIFNSSENALRINEGYKVVKVGMFKDTSIHLALELRDKTEHIPRILSYAVGVSEAEPGKPPILHATDEFKNSVGSRFQASTYGEVFSSQIVDEKEGVMDIFPNFRIKMTVGEDIYEIRCEN